MATVQNPYQSADDPSRSIRITCSYQIPKQGMNEFSWVSMPTCLALDDAPVLAWIPESSPVGVRQHRHGFFSLILGTNLLHRCNRTSCEF